LFYWFLKFVAIGPIVRLVFRPQVTGAENVPRTGAAVLASNHLSASDWVFMPLMLRRRVTFLAKAEYFTSPGVKGFLQRVFFSGAGQVPIDRSSADAAEAALATGVRILQQGKLLGIYPEGTRSPDGRLHKGKTGVARLVLQARVPVLPIGVVDTQFVRLPLLGIPVMRRPGVRIGEPLDFDRYAGAGNDRDVLRYVTDEIMAAVQELSGQTYVDAYASSVKSAAAEGRVFETTVLERPGAGRPVPPVPAPLPPVDEQVHP
jgi:1-acyl-sn-glycerol-3-phosphate acyltransferase